MAIKTIPLLFTILSITHLALAAPTSNNSLPPPTTSSPSQHPSEQAPATNPNRHHIIRVSKTTGAKTTSANTYFFDTTTLELVDTTSHTNPVPLFTSRSKDKTVVVALLDDEDPHSATSYAEIKSSASSVADGKQAQMVLLCRGLRRCGQRLLEQRLGLLILGVSLGIAAVCAWLRELCSLRDDERVELEFGEVEEGMAAGFNREKP